MMLGCVAIYAFLLGTGYMIYGNVFLAVTIFGVGAAAAFGLFKTWR